MINLTEDGACHGDDISYLFHSSSLGEKAPGIGSIEFELIKKMIWLFTNFMINGIQTKCDDGKTWEAADAASPIKCLNFSNNSTEMIIFPEEERLKAWDEIFLSC